MNDDVITHVDSPVQESPHTITVNIPVDETTQEVPSDNLQDPAPAEPSNPPADTEISQGGRPEINADNIMTTEPLEGEVVEEKNKGGRPTKYNEGMLMKAKDYLISCMEGELVKDKKGNTVKRLKMPLLEELARLCDVHGETLENWCEENEGFFETIKKLKELQKERIVQRGFQMSNPTFAIFMLKANHGMIETEKRILAGEKQGEPLQLSVTNYKDSATPQITDTAQAVIEEGSE